MKTIDEIIAKFPELKESPVFLSQRELEAFLIKPYFIATENGSKPISGTERLLEYRSARDNREPTLDELKWRLQLTYLYDYQKKLAKFIKQIRKTVYNIDSGKKNVSEKILNNVNDQFLREFIAKYSISEIKSLQEAINAKFIQISRNGKLETPDYSESLKILHEIYACIAQNLFDLSDDSGFPKARRFCDIYMEEDDLFRWDENDTHTVPTIHDIAYLYIWKHLSRNQII
jgi:DNA-binding XRE family transcriptional regulator